MGEVCEGPWAFSTMYWEDLDPQGLGDLQGLGATQGCEVKGNTNSTSLLLSFWSKSLTGSENPWTCWGKGKEEARDPLSKLILPPRCFQLLGAEPSSSSELHCQNSHKDLCDEGGNGEAPSPAGCLQGQAGLTPTWREEKLKIGTNIFWPR